MNARIIVCPIIQNQDGEYLICKMPQNRGAFPGKWGLPGGGIEPGEHMGEALKREISEELGSNLVITEIKPWTFRDDMRKKIYPDNQIADVYMIYLIFDCLAKNSEIDLNDEFEAYAWVKPSLLINYDLNDATNITFRNKGLIP
jgi:nucleoside triphosphatase